MEVREKYQFRMERIIGNPLEIITNPEGWKDFELRLKRDDEITGLLVSSTNKFTFKNDGYAVLKRKFNKNYNDKVRVAIDILQADNTYTEQYNGVVILTNVLFNLEKRTAETTIEDANFQGAISGNKNIKMFLDTSLTKNGEEITAIERFNLDYFIADGTYQSLLLRRAYLYKDALDLLVRYMTDNEVKGVRSAYLDDVNNFGGDSLPYITNGKSINVTSNSAPNVSFSELIIFLSKTHDLTFDFVENANGKPVMRIEERNFFFGTDNSETFRDLLDLTVEIDATKISSHIEVGNNNTFPSGNCSSTTRWFSFQKEDYALRGKGNIDNLIDLTTDFITDSNVIEEIVVNSTTDWDDNIFVVLGNTAGTEATRFQSTSYCSNSFFYNLEFTNDNIISRQLNALPESVTKFLVGALTPSLARGDGSFSENILFLNPLFPNVVDPISTVFRLNFQSLYDFGGNYVSLPSTINGVPVPSFYDIPFQGAFSFSSLVDSTFSITEFSQGPGKLPNITVNYILSIERWNASFTNLKESQSTGIIQLQFGRGQADDDFLQIATHFRTLSQSLSITMNCDVSDKIITVVSYTVIAGADLSQAIVQIPGGIFTCLGADADSGVFKVFDPNSFRVRQYKFEKNLSLTQSDNIRNNARSSVIINELSDTKLDKRTWIEEMVNNIETGATSFTTIN